MECIPIESSITMTRTINIPLHLSEDEQQSILDSAMIEHGCNRYIEVSVFGDNARQYVLFVEPE